MSDRASRHDPHAYDYVSDSSSSCSLGCHTAFRVLIMLLALVCTGFTAAGHGINWASYTQVQPAPPTKTHVRLWKFVLDNDEGHGFYEFAKISAVRAFMIIGLFCAFVSFILSIVYIVIRCNHEDARNADDDEREDARQEYLHRLQELRHREEMALHDGRDNSSFARDYDVRPPSHPRSHYVRREYSRLREDWGLGLSLWIFLFFTMASMAIVVGIFASYFTQEIDKQRDGKLVVGFWLMCASLICSFIAVVLLIITPASGWALCMSRPKSRKV